MLFNSFSFIFIFLPSALLGYFALGRYGSLRWAGLWLILSSLTFYAVWNPWYLLLIAGSIAANYACGIGIIAAKEGNSRLSPRLILTLGVAFNLIVLGYYKYANFFVDNCRALFDVSWNLPSVVLPLAISFFTFTQIAYLVDAFHGVTKEHDFLHYALFVSFFPHLIAGPIVSYRRLMPQFAERTAAHLQTTNLAAGFSLFALGLAKKVLIADKLAPLSKMLFDDPALSPTLVAAWVGALAYTFQLYFDFSAYSDMAIGLARMFNVRFPLNFNSPYKALDISDFWRRWHMTLSHFLRDHLYIPLGGNRKGGARRYLNLMVTMLLGGLWHGAGWTFVVWGGLHGLYLVTHHAWDQQVRNIRMLQRIGWKVGGWALTFLAVVVAWVFFRAHSLTQAGIILAGMIGQHDLGLPPQWAPYFSHLGVHAQNHFADLPGTLPHAMPLLYLVAAVCIAFFAPNADEIFRIAERYSDHSGTKLSARLWRISPAWALGTGALLAAAILELESLSEFLYFRF